MDFGDLLDQWEQTSTGKGQTEKALYERTTHDEDESVERLDRVHVRHRKHEAVLDLHGVLAADAEERVFSFLQQAHERNLRKVLIIHGKGYHSKSGQPVLKDLVYRCIERSPYAGAHGVPGREDGGSGAVWVAIKGV